MGQLGLRAIWLVPELWRGYSVVDATSGHRRRSYHDPLSEDLKQLQRARDRGRYAMVIRSGGSEDGVPRREMQVNVPGRYVLNFKLPRQPPSATAIRTSTDNHLESPLFLFSGSQQLIN